LAVKAHTDFLNESRAAGDDNFDRFWERDWGLIFSGIELFAQNQDRVDS